MSKDGMPELAVKFFQNVGRLEEIRSYADREAANFLTNVAKKSRRENILRVNGNFRIDPFLTSQAEPKPAGKRGLLTSEFRLLDTKIQYKRTYNYAPIARLRAEIRTGEHGLDPSCAHWAIYTITTSKSAWDFDEILHGLAKSSPRSRFYTAMRQIDKNTLLFLAEPVDETLTVERAVADVKAVADFIYEAEPAFQEKWKDQQSIDVEADAEAEAAALAEDATDSTQPPE